MSKAARTWAWLAVLALIAVAVLNPAARADDEYAPGPRTVEVGPGQFKNETTRVLVNEPVTFVLKDDIDPEHIYKHVIEFNPYSLTPHTYELDPADPSKRSFTVTFQAPGYHRYRCTLHSHRGEVRARNTPTSETPAPTDAETPAPGTVSASQNGSIPATAANPATAAAPTPSTAQAGIVSGASKPAANASAGSAPKPATPPTFKPLTTLINPSAPQAPSAPAPATSSAPAPDLDAGDSEAAAAGEADEAALGDLAGPEDSTGTGGSSAMTILLALGLVVVLTAAGWGWYHRPSRYQAG